MRFQLLFRFLCFLLFSFSQSKWAGAQPISIAIIKDHCDANELDAIKQTLQKNTLSFHIVSLRSLSSLPELKKYTHIWYHRTDTSAFDQEETGMKNYLQQYVKEGGNLFLSMESVPLLNAWGIETSPFQLRTDTVADEGFGRPLGFHAFKDHPIFSGLSGGVYSSKQKKDHVVRVHGFFGQTLPANGKVIGIQWTYITFTESSKLLLEYTVGKGKIIAAGSYLYYASDNYNKQHLQKFTGNVFLYMSGKLKGHKAYYWDYAQKPITNYPFTAKPIHLIPAPKWNLPTGTLSLKQDTTTKDFYDLVGRKILWMGKMKGGADEIWMHPFMALRDFGIGVKLKNTDSITWLKSLPSSAIITPSYLERTYHIRNTNIKEIYTVSFQDPAGVAHIEVDGNDVTGISLHYASNLRYMWPYSQHATGQILYNFNKDINSHIISGQNGELNTMTTYSHAPLHQSVSAEPSRNEVKISADFAVPANGALNIYITGTTHGYKDLVSLIRTKQPFFNNLYQSSERYYRSLLDHHLMIQTPDTAFNTGYRWAMARTDQFLQTTPGIGTALMAGFGTTERGWNGGQAISGRPGYAWYFGRDGEWSAMAIDAYGDFKMVREMLDALIRYQDINGKIYHELTSSGVAHYDASDATPLFVILAGHYLKYSGDLAYIRSKWPAIKKAIDFCYSTDTDGDGLIENTNVGHGWIEGGVLFGTHTEFYLAGCWAKALDAAAYMATHLGLNQLGAQYDKDALNVKRIIDQNFWNPQQQYFYNGKMIDGTYMPDATVLATVPIYFNTVTDPLKIQMVNNRLASNYFSTDWGIRIIEDSSKHYKAGSYHAGMVWPLYGGWAALSEFKTGNNTSGFQHIMNNLLIYKNWGLGSIEETLNGDVYKPNGVCSHQAWSETMVLQPAIEGMLGLESDALAHSVKLAPYFPWNWKEASVKNIHSGNELIDLEMKKEGNKTYYILTSNEQVQLSFEPRFALHTTISQVLLNNQPIAWQTGANAEGISVKTKISLKKGRTVLTIDHRGGIGVLPLVAHPQPGDTSTGLRILSEKTEGHTYSLWVEGRPGKTYTLDVYTEEKPNAIEGAKGTELKDNVLRLVVELPSTTKEHYTKSQIKILY